MFINKTQEASLIRSFLAIALLLILLLMFSYILISIIGKPINKLYPSMILILYR